MFMLEGLGNATFITLSRTIIGTLATLLGSTVLGFAFTQQKMWGRIFWYRWVIATMYFSAGLIPIYITYLHLGLINSFWVYILPGVIAPFNVILVKLIMVEAHPTTPDGQRVYGFSFFPDWDGGSVRMISEILNLYGYHWQNLYGAQLFSNWDSSSYSLMTDPDGIYLQALRLFNEAYRRGLVDPDSPTQDWDTYAAKLRDGRVMHAVWPWAGPNIFGMSIESAETTLAPFAFVPIGDMQIVMDGFSPFGTNLCAAIGAGAAQPERIIEFLDWMASPEGVMVMMNQIEGLTWEMVDGRPSTTQFGMDAIRDNLSVPAEFGGGGFADGISNFNFHFVVGNDINPMFDEPFAASRWQTTLGHDRNHFVLQWQEHFGVLSPMEYVVQNNMFSVTPGMAFATEPEDSSLQVMRSQVSTQFVNTSWQMLFARDEAEFDRLWDNLMTLLPGFGFYEVMEWDLEVLAGMADAVAYTLERFR